jgi:minor histocompatibility antigen H13
MSDAIVKDATAATTVTNNEATSSSSPMNKLLVLAYIIVGGLWGLAQVVEIPYVVNLMVLVTSILYIGCHHSLVLREEQHIARGSEIPEGYEIAEGGGETMTKEDAKWFPIMGSCSLFSLYLAFKYLNADMVNLVISFYFVSIGCIAVTLTFSPLVRRIIPGSSKQAICFKKEIKIAHSLAPAWIFGESPLDLSIDLEANWNVLVTFLISLVFSYYYFKTKHWALNNVLGICFCVQGIERFSLGTYKIGAILLVGLFFYDIFWVFGTEVMVTVATKLDGPIKILFPRSLIPDAKTGKIALSLLGLGDIVIPGFFLALLLRFDAANASVAPVPTNIHASFPKPYFHSCLAAYVLGLATTLYVMIVFKAAQPALLYLVPACLISSFSCAILRGDLTTLLQYTEEIEEEEEVKEGDTKKEESKKDK